MNYALHKAKLFNKYPAIQDLKMKAKKRIPNVAWEYLETGTGKELTLDRNERAINDIQLVPKFCKGQLNPNIGIELFGESYRAPFGVAPVGLTGLMWPKAEIIISKVAKLYGIPFSLSTVATETPEIVGPYVNPNGWFQLYPPKNKSLRRNLLDRARSSGFKVLLVTADVPAPSRRERTKRAGLTMPPRIDPKFFIEGCKNPAWTWKTIQRGLPRLRTIEGYSEFKDMMSVGAFVQNNMGGNLSWDYCEELREYWDGPIVLKGVLHPDDVQRSIDIGFDGVVISNHGARQFDGAPSSIEVLPSIVQKFKSRTKILFDSGVRSGLDVLKALAIGADFVLLGRPFIYGVCALGEIGVAHVIELLKDDLSNNMIQCGIERLSEVSQIPIFSPSVHNNDRIK